MDLDRSLLPPVFLCAVLNGSRGASRLSRTDGLRSPRANLSPKWFVSSLSLVMTVPVGPGPPQSAPLVAQSWEFTSGGL